MRFTLPALALGLCLAVSPCRAELGFPAYLTFPRQLVLDPDQSLTDEAFGEAEFVSDAAAGVTETRRGRHMARWLRYRPAPGEPAPGYYNGTEERIFTAMQAPLTAAGWRSVYVNEGKSQFVMRRDQDGKETWLGVTMDAPQAQVRVELVEVGQAGPRLVLSPPAAQPERITDDQDLPYLPPPAGSVRTGSGRGDGPLDVSRPGAGEEPMLVGRLVVTRTYQGPKSLSRLQFISDYRQALVEAGWQVLYPANEAQVADHGSIAAHYTRNGRDIWARLAYEYGAVLWVTVTDIGSEDWASRLEKECRVPLYGVFFDFNKATLKPESDAVLQKVASLLTSRPALKVEIGGHTDAVGSDAFNLALSEARAASVRAWLTRHRIDGSRVTSHGYGKARPVAGNDDDAGRARNRRVELAKAGCSR